VSGSLATASSADDLVDGDPGAVDADARRLRKVAQRYEEIGDSLKRIRADGWTGLAADNFETEMRRHPKHWFTAADTVAGAAAELETFADQLRAALKEAGAALALYEKGQELHRDARLSGDWQEGDDIPTSPEGMELQDDAQQILNDALDALQTAGDGAATKLDESVREIADYHRDYIDSDVTGPRRLPFGCDGPSFSSWSEFSLFSCEGYDRVEHDFVFDKDFFGIPLNLTGDGNVGMNGSGKATVDQEGVHASLSGMMGGVYEVTDTINTPGPDVEANGNLRLGPSVDANLDLGQDDQGKWRFKFKGGMSLIAGGGVGVDVAIPDPAVDLVNEGLSHVPGL